MNERQLSSQSITNKRKTSKFLRWPVALILVVLVGICSLSAVLLLGSFLNFNVEHGAYNIAKVTLSSDLQDGQPVDVKSIFKPSDMIICTVKTTGVDGGVIGMRWFLDDEVIYQVTGKTQNNTISSYIQSNSSAILDEGTYRVEVFLIDENDPLETVFFEVKTYHPVTDPAISVPTGHQSIELPWFPEVPFSFDEIWEINNVQWQINEVKVVLREDSNEQFVAVVVKTDIKDLNSLSEEAAKEIAKPIALYAVENGYMDEARRLEIDGKFYDLDESFYVNLVDPVTNHIYRVFFRYDELVQEQN